MQINWTPLRRDQALTVTKQGDALTLNGEVVDFTDIPDGATYPLYRRRPDGELEIGLDGQPVRNIQCDWVVSDVERIDGEITLTLTLPHGANAPWETRFPQPVVMAGDGPVPVPLHSIPEPDPEPDPEPEPGDLSPDLEVTQ